MSRLREEFAGRINFLRDVFEERVYDLEGRLERMNKKMISMQGEIARLQKEEQVRKELSDREAVIAAKEQWLKTREEYAQNAKAVRATAMKAIDEMLNQKDGQSVEDVGTESLDSLKEARFTYPTDPIRAAQIFTGAPPPTARNPLLRTEISQRQMEVSKQIVRTLRRLTKVEEDHKGTPFAKRIEEPKY
jgi:hypothetical protein